MTYYVSSGTLNLTKPNLLTGNREGAETTSLGDDHGSSPDDSCRVGC